ncbi:MAG: hypothetical protein GKR89_30165 [Candidatus Latescibacteria bacterium]|nr:hypothetical protein [Candidatus Latescibacterota bacterium]
MKRSATMTLVVVLVLSLASMVAAHEPPGELFFLYQFPDQGVPTIDGDHSDWDVVPDAPYVIDGTRLFDPAQFQEAGRGEFDISDINILHRMGWNENFNKLYLASRVFDNIHNVDRDDPARHWDDDNWEVEINPDHSARADQLLEGEPVNNISYKWVVPPVEGVYQSIEPIGDLAWLSDGTDYVSFGWSFEGEQFGESTYFYELSLTPIDALPRENATPGNTVFHDLEEEQIVHISVTHGDIDAPQSEHAYNGFWSTSPVSCCRGEEDFVPAPFEPGVENDPDFTAVESVSWGQIKAGHDR